MIPFASLIVHLPQDQAPAHSFTVSGNRFLLDGQPFQIRSGEMHYARIPRAYWADRMQKAKAMGLNTICTYVFWNLQEPEKGKFDFTGNVDIKAFVKEAQKQGLYVILRPGPYVCAEWEWGGFPWWLATIPGMAVRQNNPAFLTETEKYFNALGKQLAPLTINNGGPIILCQVENEYGSFGKDHEYMGHIRDQIKAAGFNCQLHTADGSADYMLKGGTLPDLPAAINFGGGPEGEFANLDKFRQNVPHMNGEFWCGWFDHWGDDHAKTSVQGQAADLDWMDSRNYGFSMYMFHGGTSFGWMNGANSGGQGFEPDVTSYDYDAPVSEDGRLTPKWYAFRDVIKKYLPAGTTLPEPPQPLPRISIPSFSLTEHAAVFDQLPKAIHADRPMTFEDLGQGYGFVLYRTKLTKDVDDTLHLDGLQDRAIVYINGQPVGVAEREKRQYDVHLIGHAGEILDIFVENQGRINFSRAILNEHKGVSKVLIGADEVTGWDMYKLPFDKPDRLLYNTTSPTLADGRPTLFRGSFKLGDLGDTYIDMQGWGKGNVWVNGHNLGRFWNIGAQQALFCPAPFLRTGVNEVVVLDVQPGSKRDIQGVADPIWKAEKR